MKKLVFVLICTMGLAAFAGEDEKELSNSEICKQFSAQAELMMKARQGGYPLADLMTAMEGNKTYQDMIIKAYERPRYGTKKMMDKAVENFKSDMFLDCYKSLESLQSGK